MNLFSRITHHVSRITPHSPCNLFPSSRTYLSLNVLIEPEPTDEELVARCRAGEKAAFGILIERHRPSVERLLLALFGNRIEADDALQESFLQAYLGLAQLRRPARFRAWVSTIAVNLARLQLRQARLRFAGGWAAAPLPPELAAENGEVRSRIRQAIADLPPAEREAIWRVYLDDLSHQETARLAGTTVSAVKVRVHRGRRRLAAALAGDAPLRRSPPMEVNMVEVTVWDVLAKAAHEGEKLQPVDDQRIVLLKEKTGQRALPIWIGEFEATDITRQLNGQAMPRPVTVDLMRSLLDLGGLRVSQAAVTRLHDKIFYGTLAVEVAGQEGQPAEVDCRPSDALSLALRLGIPIVVAPDIMASAGLLPDETAAYDVQAEHDKHTRAEGQQPTPLPAGISWHSLRA